MSLLLLAKKEPFSIIRALTYDCEISIIPIGSGTACDKCPIELSCIYHEQRHYRLNFNAETNKLPSPKPIDKPITSNPKPLSFWYEVAVRKYGASSKAALAILAKINGQSLLDNLIVNQPDVNIYWLMDAVEKT